jgi:tetratricopeptide (TPR) repeat protein
MNEAKESNTRKGVEAAMKNNMEEAEKYFKKAIERDEDWRNGGFNLLRLYHMQSRHLEALDLYKRLIQHIPADTLHPQVTYMAGDSAIKAGATEIGMDCYRNLHSKHPENVESSCAVMKLTLLMGCSCLPW